MTSHYPIISPVVAPKESGPYQQSCFWTDVAVGRSPFLRFSLIREWSHTSSLKSTLKKHWSCEIIGTQWLLWSAALPPQTSDLGPQHTFWLPDLLIFLVVSVPTNSALHLQSPALIIPSARCQWWAWGPLRHAPIPRSSCRGSMRCIRGTTSTTIPCSRRPLGVAADMFR